MSKASSRTRTTTRQMVALALGAFLTLLLPVGAPTAVADPPDNAGGGPSPVATAISVDSVDTPETAIDVPDTTGAPDSYIVRRIAFEVDVSFWGFDDAGEWTKLPLSHNKDVSLLLELLPDPDAPLPSRVEIMRDSVPAEATTFTFTGVTLDDPRDDVALRVSVDERRVEATADDSERFDVLVEFSRGTTIGGNPTDEGCEATPENPVCADLIAPTRGFTNDHTLMSLGVCDPDFGGTGCRGNYVQALAGFVADAEDPATLIMKCDKTLCPGGAIHDYELDVQISPDGRTVTAKPCASKGIATPETPSDGSAPDSFCVDYVQSTRDNAGDTHLYLLFTVDAKVRFP